MDSESDKTIKQKKQPKTKKEYNKTYYDKHKDRLLKDYCQKMICSKCGSSVIKKNVTRHQQTKLCKKKSLNKQFKDWLILREENIINQL